MGAYNITLRPQTMELLERAAGDRPLSKFAEGVIVAMLDAADAPMPDAPMESPRAAAAADTRWLRTIRDVAGAALETVPGADDLYEACSRTFLELGALRTVLAVAYRQRLVTPGAEELCEDLRRALSALRQEMRRRP